MGDRLDGKVCIVTGAAQGIGAAYAARAGRGGRRRRHRRPQAHRPGRPRSRTTSKPSGGEALTIKADVTDARARWRHDGRAVVGELGRVDCLVNNAALDVRPAHGHLGRVPRRELHGRRQRVERRGPYLWGQRSGSIVNISSTAAFPLPMPASSCRRPSRRPRCSTRRATAITKWMVIYQTRHMAQLLGSRTSGSTRCARRHHVAGDQGGRAPGASSTR